MTVKQLEKEIATIKQRLTKLEKRERRKNGHETNVARKTRVRQTLRSSAIGLTEQQRQARLVERMKKEGLIVELPPEAKARAAQWRALPKEERKQILDEFARLPLDRPLSEIISENRR